MYFKEHTDSTKHKIKCSTGNGWDRMEQLRWHAFSKKKQNQEQNRSSQSLLRGQQGTKYQPAHKKQLSLGRCFFCYFFCFEKTSTYHLSVAYKCCPGISYLCLLLNFTC